MFVDIADKTEEGLKRKTLMEYERVNLLLFEMLEAAGLETHPLRINRPEINFIRTQIPVKRDGNHRNQEYHIKTLLQEVVGTSPERKTEVEHIFHGLAEKITRRGVIIVISDLFVPISSVIKGIQHLRHRRHDVIVFQVLDEYELSFPFQENTLFRGLEEYPNVLIEPRSLREAYLRLFGEFNPELRRGCIASNVDFVQLKTTDHLDAALSSYLASRAARSK